MLAFYIIFKQLCRGYLELPEVPTEKLEQRGR